MPGRGIRPVVRLRFARRLVVLLPTALLRLRAVLSNGPTAAPMPAALAEVAAQARLFDHLTI